MTSSFLVPVIQSLWQNLATEPSESYQLCPVTLHASIAFVGFQMTHSFLRQRTQQLESGAVKTVWPISRHQLAWKVTPRLSPAPMDLILATRSWLRQPQPTQRSKFGTSQKMELKMAHMRKSFRQSLSSEADFRSIYGSSKALARRCSWSWVRTSARLSFTRPEWKMFNFQRHIRLILSTW